ncbi:unnamed protein product, partial [Closterium sp. NIES-65]
MHPSKPHSPPLPPRKLAIPSPGPPQVRPRLNPLPANAELPTPSCCRFCTPLTASSTKYK